MMYRLRPRSTLYVLLHVSHTFTYIDAGSITHWPFWIMMFCCCMTTGYFRKGAFLSHACCATLTTDDLQQCSYMYGQIRSACCIRGYVACTATNIITLHIRARDITCMHIISMIKHHNKAYPRIPEMYNLISSTYLTVVMYVPVLYTLYTVKFFLCFLWLDYVHYTISMHGKVHTFSVRMYTYITHYRNCVNVLNALPKFVQNPQIPLYRNRMLYAGYVFDFLYLSYIYNILFGKVNPTFPQQDILLQSTVYYSPIW